MTQVVVHDQLLLVRIEGMHCHRCEETITRVLSRLAGVNEVEVDMPSEQASVLFDRHIQDEATLIKAVNDAGYRVVSHTLLKAIPGSEAC